MENILKSKSLQELMDIVGEWPWFAAARKELCVRTAGKGDSGIATTALYMGSGKVLFNIAGNEASVGQEEVQGLIKNAPARKTRSAYGDFFSQEEYDSVRQNGDNIFSSFSSKVQSGPEQEDDTEILCYTETLAEIYLEQGYYKQAKAIYSKLSLRYPEKNTYFAALIEKLDKLERN